MDAHQLNQLREYFKNATDIEQVILFGSMSSGSSGSSGRYTAESDIDLAVQQRNPLTSAQKMNIINDVALITGRPVDLIDLRKVGEPLLGQILKQGKRLKGSNEQYAELGLKHVYAQADFVPYIERTLKERRDKWLNS